MPVVNPIGPLTPVPTKTPSVTPSISVSPSVSPSISITPSITPSVTSSPNPLISPTPTPTATPSVSATPSLTPSISTTPSVTPSITVSITPTPSITPSIECVTLSIFDQMQTAALNFMKMAVGYYKINLSETKRNIYGESLEKWFYEPILVRCLMERSPDGLRDEMFGPDVQRPLKLSIPKVALEDATLNGVVGANLLPEIGDIILDRGTERYYEVHNVITNYTPVTTNYTVTQLQYCPPVQIVIYELECHQTRISRLNLTPYKFL